MAEPDKTETAFAFFNEINIIAQLSSSRFDRVLPGGLTGSQFSVLNWFVRVDSIATPGRLAKAFTVTRGAMTNTLQKLSHKGLVVIEPDQTSGRQKIVRLTEAGLATRNEAIASAAPILEEVLGQFPAERLAEALPLLQSLRTYLDEERYKR